MEMAIIAKSDIPVVFRGRKASEDMLQILNRAAVLPKDMVLKITMPSIKEAERLRTTLLYYRNKRGRTSGDCPLKDFVFARKGCSIFLFRNGVE